MTRKIPPAELPDWPRLLERPLAAAYLGISVGTFDTLAISPVRVRSRVLYDRQVLDRYADQLVGMAGALDDDARWLDRLPSTGAM
jgi:hypothetical protein